MSKGPIDLTLAERLEYAIRHLDFWYRISLVIVLIGLASLSGIVSVSQYYFHNEIAMYGHIEQNYQEEETRWGKEQMALEWRFEIPSRIW